ncbi:Na+/melibiose symporter-like protein [Catenovulum agarivorans DS-2]|uniref:Na+/melibiose symporter-like protein n=1 Tax=Catenovulum agarivorans DS-2 TaxID=1328313 RepID=W7Q9W7_9ALTE|nr:MFS transporter [Catenovulum agarivorans]EWH09574.1 Na+/melibiose symporter-like protein [Catenovulum agarivorans DS-2]
MTKNSLSIKSKFAISSGTFSAFFMRQGVGILAIPYYQMSLAVDPFLLAAAMMVPLILASMIGPWVGQLSDIYLQKFGNRKIFILLGALISAVFYGCIWQVPVDWQTNMQLLYFAVVYTAFCIAAEFFLIPYTCLVYEATEDSCERVSLFALNSVISKVCSLFHQWAFPLAQLSIFSSLYVGVKWVGWLIAIVAIAIAGVLPALMYQHKTNHTAKPKQIQSTKLLSNIRHVLSNRAFNLLLVVTFAQFFGVVYSASMDYYLIVYYMQGGDLVSGANWKGVLSTAYALCGLIAVPIILKTNAKFGRVNCFLLVYLITFIGGLSKWFIFVPGGQYLLVIDAALGCFAWASMAILLHSLIADVAAEQNAQHGNHNGVYVSIHNMVMQLCISLAMLTSGLSLNFIGFNAEMGANQSAASILDMRMILAGGTMISALLAGSALIMFKRLAITKV